MALSFVCMASLVAVAGAKGFLETKVGASSIERALLAELSGRSEVARLASIDAELGPMFEALPKNEYHRLDWVSVRYALHRYFMQKHGWYVNGLGASNNSEDESSASIMKARAPSFIQKIFEQRLHGQGICARAQLLSLLCSHE